MWSFAVTETIIVMKLFTFYMNMFMYTLDIFYFPSPVCLPVVIENVLIQANLISYILSQ